MPGSASGNSHFGDERKFVTVLFADIVNSSRLVANQDPEEADEFLLPIIHELTDCVQKFGGTVNQILGDGIMAAFGVPDAQEDHALRACLAAQEMISAVAGIDEQSNDDRISPASIRVGLNSGEVVVQLIGEHPWQQYRLIGRVFTPRPGRSKIVPPTRY